MKKEGDIFEEKGTESKKAKSTRPPERYFIKEKLTVISGGLKREDIFGRKEEILKDGGEINCL